MSAHPWLSDQPKTWHEMNCALQDISTLLQYLGELPDGRLLSYFDDTRTHMADGGPRRSVPPCSSYSTFLNRVFEIDAAFQTGRFDGLPACAAASPGAPEGLSSTGFVYWSRDFLSAIAAPATAESIRLTRDYMIRRVRTRWLHTGWCVARQRPPAVPATPVRPNDPAEATRKQLARKLANRVQRLIGLTIAALVLAVCISIYALSGRLILTNAQDLEAAWSKLDEQVEAQEDRIFRSASLPLAADDHTTVGGLCDLPPVPQPGQATYQVAENAAGTAPADRETSRYVSARQAHLCAERAKMLLDLFVVTMHLQSWSSVVTQGLGAPQLASLFGVMPSTLRTFAAEEDGSLCRQIRRTAKSTPCEAVFWDEINRSRNVARAILGSITQYVLPVLYGFLGAMAATLRTLRRKVDASLLSYTDRARIQQGAILGILCGGVIGLFASYFGRTDAVSGLGLSAFALLAGYNVDGVFRFLDDFSDRVFRPASASPATRPS